MISRAEKKQEEKHGNTKISQSPNAALHCIAFAVLVPFPPHLDKHAPSSSSHSSVSTVASFVPDASPSVGQMCAFPLPLESRNSRPYHAKVIRKKH